MYVPRAIYSLRMSFCTVPESFARAIPRSSATTMYIASSVAAVALIVIDVETSSSGISASSACMSSTVSIATPTRPPSPRARRVGIEAHLRGEIEGDREPGLSGGEQRAEARVRLARGAEARVLAHGPQPPAIHRGLHATRERKASRIVQVARVVDRSIFRTVERFEWNAGGCGASIVARGHQRLRVIPRRQRRRRSAARWRDRPRACCR